MPDNKNKKAAAERSGGELKQAQNEGNRRRLLPPSSIHKFRIVRTAEKQPG